MGAVSDGLRRQPLRQQVQGCFQVGAPEMQYEHLTAQTAHIAGPDQSSPQYWYEKRVSWSRPG